MPHTRPSSRQHAAYQTLPTGADDAAPTPSRAPAAHLLAEVGDGLEVTRASFRPAATWTVGTLGLAAFASATSYAAHGRRHDEQVAALSGGLTGLALYGTALEGIFRAAHTRHDTAAQSQAHGAVTSLVGVTAGTLLAASGNPLLGFAGSVTAYASAWYAASILSAQLGRQEASWAAHPRAQVHGNRWLVAGMVLLGIGSMLLGWFAAVLVSALDGESPAAVTGKCVGVFVSLFAGIQVLPSLIGRPLSVPQHEEGLGEADDLA